jgi:hypothetical protein
MAFLGTALGQAAPLRRWLAGLHGVPSEMSGRDDAHAPTYIISYGEFFYRLLPQRMHGGR